MVHNVKRFLLFLFLGIVNIIIMSSSHSLERFSIRRYQQQFIEQRQQQQQQQQRDDNDDESSQLPDAPSAFPRYEAPAPRDPPPSSSSSSSSSSDDEDEDDEPEERMDPHDMAASIQRMIAGASPQPSLPTTTNNNNNHNHHQDPPGGKDPPPTPHGNRPSPVVDPGTTTTTASRIGSSRSTTAHDASARRRRRRRSQPPHRRQSHTSRQRRRHGQGHYGPNQMSRTRAKSSSPPGRRPRQSPTMIGMVTLPLSPSLVSSFSNVEEQEQQPQEQEPPGAAATATVPPPNRPSTRNGTHGTNSQSQPHSSPQPQAAAAQEETNEEPLWVQLTATTVPRRIRTMDRKCGGFEQASFGRRPAPLLSCGSNSHTNHHPKNPPPTRNSSASNSSSLPQEPAGRAPATTPVLPQKAPHDQQQSQSQEHATRTTTQEPRGQKNTMSSATTTTTHSSSSSSSSSSATVSSLDGVHPMLETIQQYMDTMMERSWTRVRTTTNSSPTTTTTGTATRTTTSFGKPPCPPLRRHDKTTPDSNTTTTTTTTTMTTTRVAATPSQEEDSNHCNDHTATHNNNEDGNHDQMDASSNNATDPDPQQQQDSHTLLHDQPTVVHSDRHLGNEGIRTIPSSNAESCQMPFPSRGADPATESNTTTSDNISTTNEPPKTEDGIHTIFEMIHHYVGPSLSLVQPPQTTTPVVVDEETNQERQLPDPQQDCVKDGQQDEKTESDRQDENNDKERTTSDEEKNLNKSPAESSKVTLSTNSEENSRTIEKQSPRGDDVLQVLDTLQQYMNSVETSWNKVMDSSASTPVCVGASSTSGGDPAQASPVPTMPCLSISTTKRGSDVFLPQPPVGDSQQGMVFSPLEAEYRRKLAHQSEHGKQDEENETDEDEDSSSSDEQMNKIESQIAGTFPTLLAVVACGSSEGEIRVPPSLFEPTIDNKGQQQQVQLNDCRPGCGSPETVSFPLLLNDGSIPSLLDQMPTCSPLWHNGAIAGNNTPSTPVIADSTPNVMLKPILQKPNTTTTFWEPLFLRSTEDKPKVKKSVSFNPVLVQKSEYVLEPESTKDANDVTKQDTKTNSFLKKASKFGPSSILRRRFQMAGTASLLDNHQLQYCSSSSNDEAGPESTAKSPHWRYMKKFGGSNRVPSVSANRTQLAPSMINMQEKGVEEHSSAQLLTSNMTMTGGSDDSDSISDEWERHVRNECSKLEQEDNRADGEDRSSTDRSTERSSTPCASDWSSEELIMEKSRIALPSLPDEDSSWDMKSCKTSMGDEKALGNRSTLATRANNDDTCDKPTSMKEARSRIMNIMVGGSEPPCSKVNTISRSRWVMKHFMVVLLLASVTGFLCADSNTCVDRAMAEYSKYADMMTNMSPQDMVTAIKSYRWYEESIDETIIVHETGELMSLLAGTTTMIFNDESVQPSDEADLLEETTII